MCIRDRDWEEHEDDPINHTIYAAEILEGEGASPELIRAIQTHTSDFNTSLPKPELQMEKILFACDELTGLIGAAVIMRPSKSVMDFTTKSLKKKFKDKRFAAGCSRDVISQGAEMLGWELPELFEMCIRDRHTVDHGPSLVLVHSICGSSDGRDTIIGMTALERTSQAGRCV